MRTVRLGWHHFLFETPADWETIGYRNDILKGQLALSNRRGEIMHVFWRKLSKKTGVRNRLVNVAVELSEQQLKPGHVRKSIEDRHGWQIYRPDDPEFPTLVGKFEEETNVLLYLVFPPHPDTAAEPRLIDQVVKSYQRNDGDERVWALVGVDITLPKSLELMRIEALPAAQMLRFENRRGEKLTVYRYGLADRLLEDRDLQSFFAGLNKRRMYYRERDFTYKDKYPGVLLSYKTYGKGGLEGFMARKWQGRAWIWRRDDINRIYCVDHNALEDHIIWDLPDRTRCQ